MGGLGNQLFQLAAGLYVSQKLEKEVRILSTWLNPTSLVLRAKVQPRKLMIEDLIHEHEWSRISRSQTALTRIAARFSPELWVAESGPSDASIERITPRTRFLVGYFQRAHYANSVRNLLLERFNSSPKFSQIIPKLLRPRIAIHMRFGDYFTDPVTRRFHGLNRASYYVDSARILLQRIDCDQIILISDDPDRALSSFTEAFGKTELHIETSNGKSEFEDLALLASSAGIVISNSSFSWWAAWIGSTSLNASVIIPIPWFATASAIDKNLALPSWTYMRRSPIT